MSNATLIDNLTDEEKLELKQLMSQLAPWTPHPKNRPQCMAYESEANEILWGGSAGGGKALALDTPIPLASGKWTTMGEVEMGDAVLDENKKSCKVWFATNVMLNHIVFKICFDNGDSIKADAEHKWLVGWEDQYGVGIKYMEADILSTEEIEHNMIDWDDTQINNRYYVVCPGGEKRRIMSVDLIETEPVRCIAVDSPSHLYLAGESMIPTHNTDVILGMARMKHTRSLILRRNFPELERSVISRALQFMGGSYNSAKHVIQTDGRRIEFGHMEKPGNPQIQGDEQQYSSAPYDLIAFDQLEEFPEYPYIFMFSRLRSAKLGQRTQMISSANWVGENLAWIIRRWRDWIGDKPTAKSGELRWYYRLKGQDEELTAPNGEPVWDEKAQDWSIPTSRTFIRARLIDNPYLGDDYKAQLQQLKEPMRSALLYGDIKATMTDNAYQLIPRAWVKAAMARWTPDGRDEKAVPVIGVDVARGGKDKTVFAPRYGNWYDNLIVYSGSETPDGASVAALALQLDINGVYNVDVIGIGSSAYDYIKEKKIANPINFGAGSKTTDKSGLFNFLNERAAQYWAFMEALDPANEKPIALPPDEELESELCAMIWVPEGKTIRMKSKEEVKLILGRSPDKADAVVLANSILALDWLSAGAQKVKDYSNPWRDA